MSNNNILQYNISELITGEKSSLDFRFQNAEIWLDDNTKATVSGNVQFFKVDTLAILARINLLALLNIACSRCLEPYPQKYEIQIDQDYIPDNIKAPEIMFTYSPVHNKIDIAEVIRQELIIELPIKPLCKQECRGLCPVCGCNLNENSKHKH